jgi:hypothetical protein
MSEQAPEHSRFADAVNAVLTENTAQTIAKQLSLLENTRSTLGARWIWELLQNARDVASSDGVNVTITLTPETVTFTHDGRPFRPREIAHLIFHGTTKLGESNDIGHFGSGFLSTHLLSRRVRVQGVLKDEFECEFEFDFWLDRSGVDPNELSAAMRQSMRDFEESCREVAGGRPGKTVYFYPLTEKTYELADTGLKDLTDWGRLVLALAPEVASIVATTPDATCTLVRGDSEVVADTVNTVVIEDLGSGQRDNAYVAIASSTDHAQAALPLRSCPSGFGIDLTARMPRLFVLFPLLGTHRLGLPTILQSKNFEPRENRDGVWLTGDSEDAITNRAILRDSVPLMSLLIQTAAQQRWAGIEQILRLDASDAPEWVESKWLKELLTQCLDALAEFPIVATESGEWVSLDEAWLPFSDSSEVRHELWNLMSEWNGSQAYLPPRHLVDDWAENLISWAALRGVSADSQEPALTIQSVAEEISKSASLDTLRDKLAATSDVVEWLRRFHSLLALSDSAQLLDDWKLLPAQTGQLCKRRDLTLDDGIAPELKDLSDALHVDLRNRLLDRRFETDFLRTLLIPTTELQVLDRAIDTLRDNCESDLLEPALAPICAKLFWFLASRPIHFRRLDGFPVASMEERDGRLSTIRLQLHAAEDQRPLAPPDSWPEGARRHVELFPRRKILNSEFAREACQSDDWQPLADNGLLHKQPLYNTDAASSDLLCAGSLPDDEYEHVSDCTVRATQIAWLAAKDSGLLDRSRKTPSRAIRFVEFLLDYVASDPTAFDTEEVPCECGQSHEYYRAAWLRSISPLGAERRWVPSTQPGQGSCLPTAESLAALLEGEDSLIRQLESPVGKPFLQALGISQADLTLRVMAPDEASRLSLIRSVGDLAHATGGADGVRELVEDIQNDPKVLETIQERKRNRQRVRQNQSIGELVEELLREQLEESGLRVERTGVGSDFEVDSDFVQNDEEVMLQLGADGGSTFVEVKSARTDLVKMTPRQAGTAMDKGEGFAVCVVPIEDESPLAEDVREQCRFLFGIGEHLAEAWAAYQGIEHATDAAEESSGNVSLEIRQGQIRFRVSEALWASGLLFDDAVAAFIERSQRGA